MPRTGFFLRAHRRDAARHQRADDFFGSVGSRPEIYPIYWSPPQMQARQSPGMTRVQVFLNAQWASQSGGVQWFDPARDSLYPDLIRRRP